MSLAKKSVAEFLGAFRLVLGRSNPSVESLAVAPTVS
jgi:hypothetical protein